MEKEVEWRRRDTGQGGLCVCKVTTCVQRGKEGEDSLPCTSSAAQQCGGHILGQPRQSSLPMRMRKEKSKVGDCSKQERVNSVNSGDRHTALS